MISSSPSLPPFTPSLMQLPQLPKLPYTLQRNIHIFTPCQPTPRITMILSHITILYNQHASKADCLCSQPGRGAAALYKLFRQTVRLESGILCLFVCEVEIICKDLKNRYFTLKIIGLTVYKLYVLEA